MNSPDNRELSVTRDIDATPEQLFRAWTEPELLKQWFCPKPWTVSSADLDVRPGGNNLLVFRSPEGNETPYAGVYLEVIPNARIVHTSAYSKAWQPAEKGNVPLITVVVTLEDLGNGKTRYTAKALHWSVEDREAHEKMGFHEGWGICTDQLAALVTGKNPSTTCL